MTYRSEFLSTLEARGFIHQCTNAEGLDAALSRGRISAYIGFDCTAPSLHVGSLIQLMILRHLQKCGHKPIVLLGGGTTKVGDPSGKDEARKVLTDADIARNLQGIKAVMSQFLTFGDGATDAVLVNNADWLDSLNYLEFLRDVGRYFSVNRMLSQDSVRMRLEREQNLSFLEFNYMVLQAYDFTQLNERYGCTLQIGGSDQWGNIIMGVDLQRRMQGEKRFQPLELKPGEEMKILEVQPMIQSKRDDVSEYQSEHFLKALNTAQSGELFGLTTPLLTTAGGAKMGKTAQGAVWLSADQLPPYEYWQFWRNTDDADVERFLKLFTDLPLEEIAKLTAQKGAGINEAKKILATEATKLAHGQAAAKKAAEAAKATFEQGGSEGLPEAVMTAEKLGKGMAAYELFRFSGLCETGGDAKRLIRQGGAKINDRKVMDEMDMITPNHFKETPVMKLTAGKKRHAVVKFKA